MQKIISINQPYFFPYLGYWQLINASHTHVLYDDVNYIKQGWINRNYISGNGESKSAQRIGISVYGQSSFKRINELSFDQAGLVRLWKQIKFTYQKAPAFDQAAPVIKEALSFSGNNLVEFLGHVILEICNYLDIETTIIFSSEMLKDNSLKGKDKVIHINKLLNATDYYNPIGGQELYDKAEFAANGTNLYFLKCNQPGLSIIDLMMKHPKEEIQAMLKEFMLI